VAKQTYRYVVVDVFTDVPLAGNQLAVFTDARAIPEELLQPLAKEMAFSETVFCYPAGWSATQQQGAPPARTSAGDQHHVDETVFVYPAAAGGHARIRIFTPATEIPFAGHPVLGTAFVLAGPLQLPEIHLETGVGVVPVVLEREGSRIVFGRMSQPAPKVTPFPEAERFLEPLGISDSALPFELYDNGTLNMYFLLEAEHDVAALEPDLGAVVRLTREDGLPPMHANCIAGAGTRWKTRMFSPADGVPEDPATGSAAGPLAACVARHGLAPFGEEIVISQGAELGRPSTLYARVEGTPERLDKVEVGGSAVIVARGEFRL
jgi:trans-2,3-dihydro-3-hydroxyanthranilate isomerase